MKQNSLLAPVSRRIRVWLATASIYALFATAAISSSIQMSVQTALAQPLQFNAESATARGNKPGEPMVLVAGGYCTTRACKTSSYVTDTAELYNPATETFSLTASMDLARTNHTATLLDDGSVLIAGGQGPGFTATAQLYYPKPARFKATGSMVNNRLQFQATLLTDGEVLVTGGLTQTGGPVPLTAAELYDPRNRTFSSTGSMLVPRTQHASTRLSDGTVLVTGGQTFAGTSITDTAELYNPSTKMFNATNGNMTSGRTGQTATRLFDGQVLVAGGIM
jgi:Galactose oxidase, central domain